MFSKWNYVTISPMPQTGTKTQEGVLSLGWLKRTSINNVHTLISIKSGIV